MKKVDNTIHWKCYRYAPENFKLSILGKQVELSNPSFFGTLAITKNSKEVLKSIKQFIRHDTNVNNKPSKYTLAIMINNKEYLFSRGAVLKDPYDNREKLAIYKKLLDSILTTPMVTEGKMTEFGKFEKGTSTFYKPLKRVKLIRI